MSLSDKANPEIHKHTITITWEEEPRKITITEDEFDRIMANKHTSWEFPEACRLLKETLFGKSEG